MYSQALVVEEAPATVWIGTGVPIVNVCVEVDVVGGFRGELLTAIYRGGKDVKSDYYLKDLLLYHALKFDDPLPNTGQTNW